MGGDGRGDERLDARLETISRASRNQRLLDLAHLEEATDAVEELRAALAAAAAAEEASRLEVVGLQRQLQAYREEEDARFQQTLHKQSEALRLHQRLGKVAEEASAQRDAATSAAMDVACLQAEIQLAEIRMEQLAGDLQSERAHAATQQAMLDESRRREGEAHARRLREHEAQLAELREAMTSSQRVDPRKYLELLQPACARLTESLRAELALSNGLGAAWSAAEVESAHRQAALASARLEEEREARRRAERQRADHHAHELRAARDAVTVQLDELRAHTAELLSNLQEGETASRAAQQRVLEQLQSEREGFHTTLKALQAQLFGARAEVGRANRIRSRLVAKVMAGWEVRRLAHIVGAWRAHVVRVWRTRLGEREDRAHANELRLTASAMLLAITRWRQRELRHAFAALRAAAHVAGGRRCADASRRSERRKALAPGVGVHRGVGGMPAVAGRRRRHHHQPQPSPPVASRSALSHHHGTDRRGTVAPAAGGGATAMVGGAATAPASHVHGRGAYPVIDQRRAHQIQSPSGVGAAGAVATSAATSAATAAATVAATVAAATAATATTPAAVVAVPGTACAVSSGAAPVWHRTATPTDVCTDAVLDSDPSGQRRAAYLEYLRACLRQQRPPAPEVVEVGRAVPHDAASLLSLQVRTAEDLLGLAPASGATHSTAHAMTSAAAPVAGINTPGLVAAA